MTTQCSPKDEIEIELLLRNFNDAFAIMNYLLKGKREKSDPNYYIGLAVDEMLLKRKCEFVNFLKLMLPSRTMPID